MARNGGVAAPDPALAAKRAILFLQAFQRARTQPQGSLSAATLRRLHAGGGLVNGVGLAGTHAVDAQQMAQPQADTILSALGELRKRLGSGNQGIYAQPY